MRKYLLILLCFLSLPVFADTFTETETFTAGPWYFSYGGERIACNFSKGYEYYSSGADIEVTSCDVSSSRDITLNRYEVFSSYGDVNVYVTLPFSGDNFDREMKCTITITWTIKTCPDRSGCKKVICQTCGEWYCSVHETHTGCSADDHADGDHTYNPCPKGCGVCMTCTPDHVGPCEGCGQQVYGCEKDHECPADCGHDNPCPKCGKVCMTCNPSHVGPCEDCQQPVYGCETNHKCHDGEFGHPLNKCPNCDVCLTCEPSHGSTCEHCDNYFYACENHNPEQVECSVCHAVYWSCVGHDVANLCPTCHGNNFCGVNGCKVCLDCNPDHIHEDGGRCPVCQGTNFCPYCKICLNCNQHMALCDTCKKAYFACRDHDCEGGTDGVCPVCLKKNFCSKCGLCINCNPAHCNNEDNPKGGCPVCGTAFCTKCGKCPNCNKDHCTTSGGCPKCGKNYFCKVCGKCQFCNGICVHGDGTGCGHKNLCSKCGKVCMTCNPQHKCGGGSGGDDGSGDDEEETEYPELEIPESPEFKLPTSEALTLLLEKLAPPSFTRRSSGSSGSDVVVIGGINYPKFRVPLDLSGSPFHASDYSFEVDCAAFASEPLSLLPSITKAASVVLFAYVFILAVIRSLRQW